MARGKINLTFTTDFGSYQVADTIYTGRPARLLYSGDRSAAQSGLALDNKPELLFDYNERFMELVRGLQPANVLVIGGGAFTLPKAIIETLPSSQLTVVEPDDQLLAIAKQHFEFAPSETTSLERTDGLSYLQISSKKYDLVVIDAFVHTDIPDSLTTDEFAGLLAQHLLPHGVIAMNLIAAYHGIRSAALHKQVGALQSAFETVGVFPAGWPLSAWLPQNFIITAQKDDQYHLADYLRYAPLAQSVSD